LNTKPTLSAGDIAAVQNLYGPRLPDINEGDKTNDTVKQATRLKYSDGPGGFDGATPIVGYGDLTTRGDIDIFYLKQLSGYTGPITFRVQTEGISLLAPNVVVTNSAGRVLTEATTSGTTGGIITLTLPKTTADETYYVRISAATGTTNPIGRYSIAGSFDAKRQPTAIELDTVMRGPYDRLKSDEIQKLFSNPNNVFFDDDLHTNDTVAFAQNLRAGPGNPSTRHLQTTASLSDSTDLDWYRVRATAASTGQTWVMTTSVRAVSPNGIAPRVEVYDENLARLSAEVIVNGDGTFTIQSNGTLPDKSYFVKVFSTGTGNYALDVTFGTATADLKTLASGVLNPQQSTSSYTVYIGQTQLLSNTLAATGATGSVRLDVLNSAGVVVYTLTAGVGDTVSGQSMLLTPGEYRVRFTAIDSTGPVQFKLRGTGLTDPIGPIVDSTVLAPLYQSPTDPTVFHYPDGTITTDPFVFLFGF
jgi:hypothetical protein